MSLDFIERILRDRSTLYKAGGDMVEESYEDYENKANESIGKFLNNPISVHQSFSEKREKLEGAKINLKKKFFGIDNIIDTVIDKLSAWYLFPEVITRPLVINLWGMTGVGKTDLIRSIVKELSFQNRFMETQMSNKDRSGNWETTIQSKLNSSDLLPNRPGILLLDEFQRFRTVDEEGREIRDYDFQDIWTLLSDGRFGIDARLQERLMDELFDAMRKKEKASRRNPNEDGEKTFYLSYWKAKELKGTLSLLEDIGTIMSWNEDKVKDEVISRLENPEYITEQDYSQLLIFVSGNLDEAFRDALDVSDADQDVEDLHERTKSINLIHIKESLSCRFKPEQISRLGNIHIIYPSLSRFAFEKIIRGRLDNYQSMVLSKFGTVCVFDEEISKFIFSNGVFPVQGTRPVLSTVDDMFNLIFPTLQIHAIENELGPFKVTYDGTHAVGTWSENGTSVKIELLGALDDIRSKRVSNRDDISMTAVHEAGHALLAILLFKVAPKYMTIDLTSVRTSGTTHIHSYAESRERFVDMLCCGWGGRCAEEIVFGVDNTTAGAIEDLRKITAMASDYIRALSWGPDQRGYSHVESDAHEYATSGFLTNVDASNASVEQLVRGQGSRAKRLLLENQLLLKDMAVALIASKKLSSKDMVEICKKHSVECAEYIGKEQGIPNYEYMLQQFGKKGR